MIFDNDQRFVKLLQNRSPEASQLLSTTSPLWFWRRIKLAVHFHDEFLSFLCCEKNGQNNFSSQYHREPVIFQPIFLHFSGILPDSRPIWLLPVIAPAILSIVLFDDTSWLSSATAPLVKLGLFSSLHRSKSVTTGSSIFCPLTGSAEMSPLDFTATVK